MVSSMDVRIDNKDMVINSCGDLCYVQGLDELLQRVKIACSIKKASFRYNRELGCDTDDIDMADPMLKEKLELVFCEATVGLVYDRLTVEKVVLDNDVLKATVNVSYMGQSGTTEVTING